MPKLLDFGVAKLMEGGGLSTRTGSVLGTPTYMAPEQLRGLKDIGPAADVWSMGVLLFRSLAGSLPVDVDNNPMQALIQVTTRDLPSLAERAPDVPAPICAVVDAALQREPSARISAMSELLDRLLAAYGESGVSVRDPRADL